MKRLMVISILFHATVTGYTGKDHGAHKTTAILLPPLYSKRTVVSSPVSPTEGDNEDESKDQAKHLIFDMSLAQIASKYNMKHLQDLIARTKVEGNDGNKNTVTEAKVKDTIANSTAIDANKNSTKLKNQLNSSTETEALENSTNSYNSTGDITSSNEPKKELKELHSPTNTSKISETTGTRRGETTNEVLCENCLNNCTGLVKSVTSLPDLTALPLESKVLPNLLSCYYGNNNSSSVEDLHTAALLDHTDELGGPNAAGRRNIDGEEGPYRRNIQERSILTNDEIGTIAESPERKLTDTESSEKFIESGANRASRSKSNRITKSIRSTIRSKSRLDDIEKKDAVNNVNIIAALAPLKEREGYLNILNNVDALLKNPTVRKRGEGTDADGGEGKEKGEKVKEDDQDIEVQKQNKGESLDQGVEDKDWDDLEKERNEKDNPPLMDDDRLKIKGEDDKNEKQNARHNEKGWKGTQKLEKSHAKEYELSNKDDGSGSSLTQSAPSARHKGDETDKEDGAAFLNNQITESAEKRHNKASHGSAGRYLHSSGLSVDDEGKNSDRLKDQSSKKKSLTAEKDEHSERDIKTDSFRRQFSDVKRGKNNENNETNRKEESTQTVTKESIARTNTGEENENTNILTAQLNTQITDLENKLIQQKLAEELKQFTTEQNPPGTTGPTTSEIVNFEKNLEKSFEYDPELRNLERGKGGRSHDYLVFNGGHTPLQKGEKDEGLYDELRKSGDAIDKYEKETTAKLLKMYSPKLTKDAVSKFDSDDYRSKLIDTDPSKLEGTDRIDLYEKDAAKIIDRNPPKVASSILEKDRAELVEAVGASASLVEGNGATAQLGENDGARARDFQGVEPTAKPPFVDNKVENEVHHGLVAGRGVNPVENALHRQYISPNMNLQGHYDVRNHPDELLEQYTHPSDVSNSLPSKIRMQDSNPVIDTSHRLLDKYTNPEVSHIEEEDENPKYIELEKERFNQNPIYKNQPAMDGRDASDVSGKDFSDYNTENENDVQSATRKGEESTAASIVSSGTREAPSTAASGRPATSFAPTFSYDPNSPLGPDSWQRINRDWTCKGRKQSPININTNSISSQELIRNIMLRSTKKNTRNAITGVLKNNGHAPTISLSKGSNGVKLFGGTLNGNYYLKQLHFHFGCNSSVGSEHRIDGKAYPVELHLVFWDNSTYSSFSEAAKSDRGVAVIAVLYRLAPKYTVKDYPLSQITKILRHVENQGDSMQIFPEDDIRLEDLVPNLMSSDHAGKFYTYEGSLSSPGCYETVTWIVIASQPQVTKEQLQTFRTLKSSVSNKTQHMCNNFRPVQPTNGRKVFSNII